MPIRPPVANWNRGELEDHFYRQYDQLIAVKKRNNELEKKNRMSSNKIRNALENENRTETEEKCEQLERENRLLAQKLKSLRHQLIAYTRPRANNTTLTGLTSRSSARVQSRAGEDIKADLVTRNVTPTPVINDRKRVDTLQNPIITESKKSITEEKSTIIKLHRENADLADLVSELQQQQEKRETKFNQLRDEYDKTVGKLQETRQQLKALKAAAENSQDVNAVTFLEREIGILKDENKVLKAANDRLVKNSLNDTDSTKESARDLQTLQNHVQDLELRNEKLQNEHSSIRKQLKTAEAERKSTLTKYRNLKEKALVKQAQLTEALAKRRLESSGGEPDRDELVMSPIIPDSPVPVAPIKKSKSRQNTKNGTTANESVLNRLFSDVTAIIESHVTRSDSTLSLDSRNEPESAAKWRQLYEAIYAELEKLRNLLMLQHRINDRQTTEIAMMNDINANNKEIYEKKLAEFVLELNRRAKRIQILENQLHSIAIGEISEVNRALLPDKFVPKTLSELTSVSTTELSLRLTKLSLAKNVQLENVFLSLEFFDFELETTPLLSGPEAVFEYVALYDIVVSNLFVHYLETEGLTIELFDVNGVNYNRRAVGTISLKKLLQTETPARISGKLQLTHPDSNSVVAVLEYNLDVPINLIKALKVQKRHLTASSYLPVGDNDVPKNIYNELEIAILRATGLNNLALGKVPSTYVAYQIYDLHPHMTTTHAVNSNPEYNDVRGFNLPIGTALHRYLKSDELQIFIVEEDRSIAAKQNALGSVTLPLFALARNQTIKGDFPLMDTQGQMTSATLTICLSWRQAYTFNDENLEVRSPMAVDYPKKQTEIKSDATEKIAQDVVSETPKRTPTMSSVSSNEDGTIIEVPQSNISSNLFNVPSAPPESPEEVKDEDSNSSTNTFMVDDKDLSDELRLKIRETSADESLLDADVPEHRETPDDHKKRLERILMKTTSQQSSDSSEASSDYMKSPDSDIELPDEAELKAELEKLERERDGDITPTQSPRPVPPPRRSDVRGVEFKEPLHSSIPPSEESSQAESLDGTPRPPPRQKSKPDFNAIAATSAIKAVPIKVQTYPTSPEALGSKITMRLGRLTLTEQSNLLDSLYDDVNVFIEWTLLDFADETCETPESVPLPRNTWTVATFECEQVYELNSRRVALLKQWIENNSRLNFDLVTDPNNQDEGCDDLAVAQLDLRDVISSSVHNITFYDADGDPIATLDLTVIYSDELTQLLVDNNV